MSSPNICQVMRVKLNDVSSESYAKRFSARSTELLSLDSHLDRGAEESHTFELFVRGLCNPGKTPRRHRMDIVSRMRPIFHKYPVYSKGMKKGRRREGRCASWGYN